MRSLIHFRFRDLRSVFSRFLMSLVVIRFAVVIPAAVASRDFVTEFFETGDNDLEFRSILFTPNGSVSSYGVTENRVTSFYTNPAADTRIYPGDDGFVTVGLGNNKTVLLYGTA